MHCDLTTDRFYSLHSPPRQQCWSLGQPGFCRLLGRRRPPAWCRTGCWRSTGSRPSRGRWNSSPRTNLWPPERRKYPYPSSAAETGWNQDSRDDVISGGNPVWRLRMVYGIIVRTLQYADIRQWWQIGFKRQCSEADWSLLELGHCLSELYRMSWSFYALSNYNLLTHYVGLMCVRAPRVAPRLRTLGRTCASRQYTVP